MMLRFPTPGPILTAVPFNNSPRPGGDGNWTKRLVGGDLFLRGPEPRHGWVSVYDPNSEFDQPLTEVSGIALDPRPSNSDLPFVHPFGNDFEFELAPDAPYFDLVAETMEGSYSTATERARTEFNMDVPGVIGVETDLGLVPGQYKPEDGDRVCVWGRLIVDAGHSDFHTEIHPYLVMASARPTPSAQQDPSARTPDATIVRITSRPFLVSQEFPHGSLFNHFLVQLGEAVLNPFSHIDAHPRLMPKPFAGLQTLIFDIRPPTPRRRRSDRLILESTITRRNKSVALAVTEHPDGGDAVRAMIMLNETGYDPPSEPARHDFTVKRADLEQLDPTAAAAMDASIFALAIAGQPQVAAVIAKGFPTHRYDHPRAASAGHASSRTRQPVSDLPGVPTNMDNGQPFPLFGTLKLEWEREGIPDPEHQQ
jgi:hypothetical protein